MMLVLNHILAAWTAFARWVNTIASLWQMWLLLLAAVGMAATRFHLVDRLLHLFRVWQRDPGTGTAVPFDQHESLNAAFEGHAKLWCIRPDGMPRIAHRDPAHGELSWLVSSAVKNDALRIRQNLMVNSSHGLALDDQFQLCHTTPLRVVRTDFADVLAGRQNGQKPPIVSAGAIVFCPTDRSILLLHRSNQVATFPNCLHTVGGNYEPRRGIQPFDDVDDNPLRFTALRELVEETGLLHLDPARALILVGEEISTGFIAFTYAAVSIPYARKKEIRASDEGAVEFYTLDTLATLFETGTLNGKETRFVPLGALSLLCWLSMGGPDQNRHLPIRKDALAAYKRMKPNIAKVLEAAAVER